MRASLRLVARLWLDGVGRSVYINYAPIYYFKSISNAKCATMVSNFMHLCGFVSCSSFAIQNSCMPHTLDHDNDSDDTHTHTIPIVCRMASFVMRMLFALSWLFQKLSNWAQKKPKRQQRDPLSGHRIRTDRKMRNCVAHNGCINIFTNLLLLLFLHLQNGLRLVSVCGLCRVVLRNSFVPITNKRWGPWLT